MLQNPKYQVLLTSIGLIFLFVLFLVSQPTINCAAEEKNLKDYITKNWKILSKSTKYKKFYDAQKDCKEIQTVGGCYRFFNYIKELQYKLETYSYECSKEVSQSRKIRHIFYSSMEVFSEIAFSDQKNLRGWLGDYEMELFCTLQKNTKDYYGEEELFKYQKKILSNKVKKEAQENTSSQSSTKSTPKSSKKIQTESPIDQYWEKSIFALQCHRFL